MNEHDRNRIDAHLTEVNGEWRFDTLNVWAAGEMVHSLLAELERVQAERDGLRNGRLILRLEAALALERDKVAALERQRTVATDWAAELAKGKRLAEEHVERLRTFVIYEPCAECGLSDPFRVGANCATCERARSALSAVSSAAEPFVLALEWTCEHCGWSIVMNAPGFAGDGFNHFPDGRTACGPLVARRRAVSSAALSEPGNEAVDGAAEPPASTAPGSESAVSSAAASEEPG